MSIAELNSPQASAPVNVFFREKVASFISTLRRLESRIAPEAAPVWGDAVHRELEDAFLQSQEDCRDLEFELGEDRESIAEAQKLFREMTEPWFSRSWIAHRARTKPSGFAGDYEMLVKLYEMATPARGIGGYLDLCIIDLPLARAVRARMKATRDFLLEEIAARSGEVRVLDIASGPCREYLDFPAMPQGRKLSVTAMDNDPVALQYVETAVVPQLDPSATISPVRYNAMRTRSAETTTELFGRFDIIYSVGLCDYLTDDHLIGMFSAWHNTLAPGGKLYIAFKDMTRYNHAPYQWHLDWFFYQRTHDDVLRLYEAAGFDVAHIETSRDATGIIINYVAQQDAATELRIDAAHPRLKRPRRADRLAVDAAGKSAQLAEG